jgi:hypothetical protein
MESLIVKALGGLPTLRKEKKPGRAALIGFAFGGIGLGLYFRSFIDFLVPVATLVAVAAISKAAASGLASAGWLGGAALAGVYGFYRAQDSNKRLGMPGPTS